LARWTITQRAIHVVLPPQLTGLRYGKPTTIVIKTIGDLLVARRKEAGLTQEKLAEKTGIHRQWLGRWERNRALPTQVEWTQLRTVLPLPATPKFV